MKKMLIIIAAMLALLPTGAWAQTANSSASSNVGVNANPSINQTFQGSSEGQGRWYVAPVQPYSPPLFPYLGPFNSGANILEDLRIFPDVLTRVQAIRMYKGGVDVRLNKFEEYNYQFDTCRLMHSLPMRQVISKDGKPVVDKSGQAVMVPDETKFKRVAIITLKGNEDATTADLIAKAVLEAMDMGATGIVLNKKVALSGTATSGWGIGGGGVAAQLGGQGQTNAQTGSFGTGYNRAQAGPTFKDSMSVIAIQE